jgi:uncharacterized protein
VRSWTPPERPQIVPVFPLPNVVFFPSTVLPLHIFEPRYRKLVARALETEQKIMMALLKPGTEAEYFGNPPIFPLGCVGHIVDSVTLPDGRYEIVLTGLGRVDIMEEIPGEEFRQARVRYRVEEQDWIRSPEAGDEILRLLELFRTAQQSIEIVASGLDLKGEPSAREMTLNTMAMHLNVPATTRLALLQQNDLRVRAAMVGEILRRSGEEHSLLDRYRGLAPDDPQVN